MPQDRFVFLLGLGNVGRVLLRQILKTRAIVAQRTGLRLVPVGLADISGLLFAEEGLSDNILRDVLETVGSGHLLDSLAGTRPLSDLEALIPPGVILTDVTASTSTALLLQTTLERGSGVVLANKNALINAWDSTKLFFEHPRLRYECTVGAGLPVIQTLQQLLDTGDQVTAITGCMSGTLGYLCAELERGIAYSTVVSQARALGYTEPDPRDDLSGHDVARKALILARTAGWPLEMADLTVEPLYPAEMAALTTGDFMVQMSRLDQDYAARFQQAQSTGHMWRYMAQVGPSGGTVGLQAVPIASPLGALNGPANYIAFYTTRYNQLPLVISGPGAGPEVTAAGVLSDILVLAAHG